MWNYAGGLGITQKRHEVVFIFLGVRKANPLGSTCQDHVGYFWWGLRIWGSPQESARGLGCSTKLDVLITAYSIRPPFSTKYFASMKRQPLNASCFKLIQAGTVFCSAVCVYACTMCPTLFGTLCCSIASNNFSRFLGFFPVTPSFSVAWQSYCPCSDFTLLLYWNTLKLVFRYFMHVKTFVNLVKIKRNSSLIYFSLKPKKYSH